jgi:Zn-dependent protease with chaperone function
VPIVLLVYLFTHSALIARLKGNRVELSPDQCPDIYAQFVDCCGRLQMDSAPKAYILNCNGVLNAFATKFLRVHYVVLMSDVIDALHGEIDGLRFYMGHELGHLRMKHPQKQLLRWPVLWLPLLGAAYSRARESTCDRHGLMCSDSAQGAVQALSILAIGKSRWRELNSKAYLQQAERTGGFWMSFHELLSGYPWLTKRAARLSATNVEIPRRHP